ncbi:hemagglutinin repeat-containing protein [Pannonibacter phragmitetus]|nr:hemagglutinin repeat-containing protein [Pannonibacter phragmitetus]
MASESTSMDTSSSSRSAGVSVTVGVGMKGANVGVGASVSAQNGTSSSAQTAHTNTNITVGGHADVSAGRDIALKGALVDAWSAEVEAGRNLTVESQLDTGAGSSADCTKAFDADASRLEDAQAPHGLDQLPMSRAHRELV